MVLRWTWIFINDFTLNMELFLQVKQYVWYALDQIHKITGFFYLNEELRILRELLVRTIRRFLAFLQFEIFIPLADQISKLWEN